MSRRGEGKEKGREGETLTEKERNKKGREKGSRETEKHYKIQKKLLIIYNINVSRSHAGAEAWTF